MSPYLILGAPEVTQARHPIGSIRKPDRGCMLSRPGRDNRGDQSLDKVFEPVSSA